MPIRHQDRFDHLVVLMLENRSFDNLCGYLYEHEQPKQFIPDTDRVFRGVAGRDDLANDDGGDPPTEYRVRKAPVLKTAGEAVRYLSDHLHRPGRSKGDNDEQ